jgi:drug/metabolite transporter (DMT)-like permease
LSARRAERASAWAPAALVFNAFVWGTSWWPLRHLQAHGLHPLWATALVFALACFTIAAVRPKAVGQLLHTPALWLLVVAAGCTNAAFNWAIVIGDVVRVVLLFYLMPLWTVLLARAVLGERQTRRAALRVALGIAGAAIVLWPEGQGSAIGSGAVSTVEALPVPRSLADWLGVVGGFSFACNNGLLRREASRPEEGRSLAMFAGGAIVAGALALALTAAGSVAPPPAPAAPWLVVLVALTVAFIASNLALQYGAARLPANRTAVVMLTEVVFASLSALALGGGALTARLAIGGALIVGGALLAALEPGR